MADSENDDQPNTSDVTNINGIKPNLLLADGEKKEQGDYVIKRIHDHYSCTCMGWKVSKLPIDARSCKHLKLALGDSYETARLKWKNPQGLLRPGLQAKVASPKKRKADDGDNDGDKVSAKKKGKKAKNADEDDDGDAAEKFTAKNRAKRDEIKEKAPALLLAQKYEPGSIDPTGWWISEKLDGVRAFWDHERREFVSRLGNPFTAPDWFKDAMPKDHSLDGELFGGRGKFSETVSVVKTINSPHWKKINFQVFDSPTMTTLPFEQRIVKLKSLFPPSADSPIILVAHEKCISAAHIVTALKDVESKGGEGLMLREPKSMYIGKRSTTLLKVKSFYDAEAIVIGYEAGKGRNANVTGSLKCRMASGKEFKIGTGLSDAERQNPPKIGAIVTYRFQELTNDGIPRFPSFVGVRIDADKPVDAVVRVVSKKDD
ncbi:DNA ligase/mRNA capping enzyme [Rhizoclosmatium globosum]|uniref:DNA ligase/mRNA capping enzyme n=1 Tax=Rhizoclosmatium globosum TaxID=329046 RepID=A0A1Y2CDV6_9FUNG|nr:DNA ligase/mRNA capping enzyme [Rhizoclosmatium globosum]|eukprot:ORY45223.1 DNA ligase/mRNA capping enzyme [Rhizoclosmatium globosum]